MSRIRRRNRGVTSLLAMLYLVLFATLAVGFYASSNTSTQVAHNDQQSARAMLACESGTSFMRYQMALMNLPYGTNTTNLMANTATALGACLDGTPNMGGQTVAVSGGAIHIPSATGWVALDEGTETRFRATVTQKPGTTTLVVNVRGAAAAEGISRAIQLEYKPRNGSFALMGLSGVTMSGDAYTDSYNAATGSYSAATAGKKGSIISNGDITLNDFARIEGDARPGFGRQVTTNNDSSVTGWTAPMPSAVTFPSVTLPATYTNLGDVHQTSGTVNIPGGTYLIRNLTLGGTARINWQGPVTLYIQNSYNVSGDVVINTYQNKPANRVLNFLPTCATATWTGTNVCVGDLYAPDTAFTISGSVQKLGRITARTITNSSSGGMHSDESLPMPGGAGNYEPDLTTYAELK